VTVEFGPYSVWGAGLGRLGAGDGDVIVSLRGSTCESLVQELFDFPWICIFNMLFKGSQMSGDRHWGQDTCQAG
jgi:hypothetical protein